uniref:Uncharacterized protein n=1 Tax=Trichobilharzia regenti TaxID=157069 RepID=A0AA85KBZ1_TRIRE
FLCSFPIGNKNGNLVRRNSQRFSCYSCLRTSVCGCNTRQTFHWIYIPMLICDIFISGIIRPCNIYEPNSRCDCVVYLPSHMCSGLFFGYKIKTDLTKTLDAYFGFFLMVFFAGIVLAGIYFLRDIEFEGYFIMGIAFLILLLSLVVIIGQVTA